MGIFFDRWRSVVVLALVLGSFQVNGATLPAGFTESQFGADVGGVPTAMAFAPDGRLFVCLQGGQLRVIKNGALLATPFVSLSVNSTGERGLLGIAFDPNFSANQFVYLYYTTSTSPIHNRISRFTANGDVAVAGSEMVLMDLDNLSATNHNGGALHFAPDGKLYAGVGENAVGANAQTLSNRLGKILRINSDGTIPTDNPFFGTATGANRAIWALGLRNPYTFGFQPGTGRMFINDVGQNAWEEIDDGIAGSNYGWSTCEGACATPNPNFRDPLFQYGHGTSPTTGCAIVGAAFYNPPVNQFPASYIGKYFFADLCSGWIRVFDPATKTASAFTTGISTPVDLQVGPDGCLYYLAQGNGGEVFRVSATPAQPLNISVRSRVGTGTDVLISGFINIGTAAKKVILRALGPSLQQSGVSDPLSDPVLELHAGDGSLITTNNDWRDNTAQQQQDITANQLAPPNNLESAIVITLQPGTYTAVVRGNGATAPGVAVLEVYDVDHTSASRLANISGRASVLTGSNVLFSGFIVGNNIGAAKVVVRALGPSLAQSGIADPLADPTLEVRDNNGALVIANNNWQDDTSQAAQISANGLAPANPAESAVATSLVPGTYTAIVAGNGGGTGVGLIEVYNLP
ncbi:MAG TPA: PQQ-dependent sugar dehydrogenase [Chthoniobacterales bacterium]|nr:PQQ-dependent sugar dehydrogenase [Chthoniobacterales bacterium]